MKFERASGLLLHPTSFPGPYGIGDLGSEAYRFVDFLASTHQKLWQVLPLGPTGYGDSPYACFSAFAGNPLLISPEILLGQGLLIQADLDDRPDFSWEQVEFGPVLEWKMALLARSFEIFKEQAGPDAPESLTAFEEGNRFWLDDYALFMAAKSAHQGVSWNDWPEGLRLHQPAALVEWRQQLADGIAFQKYIQFLFFQQWESLRQYANQHEVKIVGDLPIFVAYDSADVWSNPAVFHLDETGRSTVVAGVPPDYFSATGQRWGNPLYRWEHLAENGYQWWVERFRAAFRLTDLVRLDHFRGFESYWEVPAQEETAINGHWVAGPREALFQRVFGELGDQPIIAEDLGLITEAVTKLRVLLDFPGMRVLQFAFGEGATALYLPHNYDSHTLVYTGNHDNDTTRGWYEKAAPHEREYVWRYLAIDPQTDPAEVTWQLVRLAWSSVAAMAIAPLQDILAIGSEGRMNAPGQGEGNWAWRYHPDSLSEWAVGRLSEITLTYGRYIPPNPISEEQV